MSEEFGLEGLKIFDRAINSEKFLQVLDSIETFGNNYCLECDNATIHKSKLVFAELKRRKTFAILQPPYTPQLNAAELGINTIKTLFRRIRQKSEIEGDFLEFRQLIEKAAQLANNNSF